jgi:hypothetical protein
VDDRWDSGDFAADCLGALVYEIKFWIIYYNSEESRLNPTLPSYLILSKTAL